MMVPLFEINWGLVGNVISVDTTNVLNNLNSFTSIDFESCDYVPFQVSGNYQMEQKHV